jgi:hypothetical protein
MTDARAARELMFDQIRCTAVRVLTGLRVRGAGGGVLRT